MTTLSVRDLDVFIQTSHILRRVSLDVGPREVVCLVGRNGAGKSTLLRTVMGYLRPRGGHITFKGTEIAGRPTYEIATRGKPAALRRWLREQHDVGASPVEARHPESKSR